MLLTPSIKITVLTFLARKSKMVEVFWGFYCLTIREKRAKSTTHLCGIHLSDRPHFLLVYRRNLQTIHVRGLVYKFEMYTNYITIYRRRLCKGSLHFSCKVQCCEESTSVQNCRESSSGRLSPATVLLC